MKIRTSIENVKNGLQDIIREGGDVRGDSGGGSVSIQGVEARYAFSEGILTVVIDDTPFLVSESYVEEKIREYFI